MLKPYRWTRTEAAVLARAFEIQCEERRPCSSAPATITRTARLGGYASHWLLHGSNSYRVYFIPNLSTASRRDDGIAAGC